MRFTLKPTLNTLYYIALFLYIFTLPLGFKPALSSVSLGLLAIGWIIMGQWAQKWKNLKRNHLVWLWVIFFIWNVATIFYSEDKRDAYYDIQVKLPLLALSLFILSVLLSKKLIHILLKTFITSVFLGSVVNVIVAFVKNYQYNNFNSFQNQYFFYHELSFINDNHAGFFSIYVLLSIFCIFYLFQQKDQWILSYKVVSLFIFIFLVGHLFMLSARFSILFFVVWIFISISIFFYRHRFFIRGALISVGILVISFIIIRSNTFLYSRLLDMVHFREDAIHLSEKTSADNTLGRNWDGSSLRWALWQCGWQAIQEKPWSGVGSGDVIEALEEKYKLNNFHFAYMCRQGAYSTHNEYLTTWLAGGIINIVLLITILSTLLKKTFKARNELMVSFTLLIIFFLAIEDALHSQLAVGFIALFSCLFYQYNSSKD